MDHIFKVLTFAVVDLEVAGFLALEAAGLASGFFSPFLASLVGPDGPFGRSNSPDFSPAARAWLMCLSKAASVVPVSLLLDLTYFLMA